MAEMSLIFHSQVIPLEFHQDISSDKTGVSGYHPALTACWLVQPCWYNTQEPDRWTDRRTPQATSYNTLCLHGAYASCGKKTQYDTDEMTNTDGIFAVNFVLFAALFFFFAPPGFHLLLSDCTKANESHVYYLVCSLKLMLLLMSVCLCVLYLQTCHWLTDRFTE